ncbi:hypothetical protein C8F04DRAFT_1127248 [Mycena alexandri]|uniref:DUF6534 domain-containing protein n=1 Tax=Mycena alexandri TaxID=1745969 RepID=A0AAD6SF11_9AGAR|nr:hypothetical protein C8F04DRAFT_1127248 [Mycena alexandri]
MDARDIGFGCALLGTWFSSLFTGVAFSQAYHYFHRSPNDGPLRKGLVATLIILCSAAWVGEYAEIYFPTVAHWGDLASLATDSWATPFYTISNATAGVIVNTYLIYRFYNVSKNIILAVLLGLLNLFSFVMAFLPLFMYAGVGHTRTLEDVQKVVPLTIIWTVACAICDVAIAISLVWTLRGMKTTFTDTDRLLHRVTVISVRNGCATSLASIGAMLGTIILPYIAEIFLYMLAPLYLMSLLSNLNLRGSRKSGNRTWSYVKKNTVAGNTSIVINGIHVHHTVHTTGDPTVAEIEMATRKGQEDDGTMQQKQEPSADGFRSQQIHFGSDSV